MRRREEHLSEATARKVAREIIANLSNIEASEVFLKGVSFYQEIEEISTAHVFEDL